jgi:phosphatidylinositol 3,5-bisphosphate 5-phosphatase
VSGKLTRCITACRKAAQDVDPYLRNPSPFMPRHRHSTHSPRYVKFFHLPPFLLKLSFYDRLMDGVRRWISSGSPSNRKSTHTEHRNVPSAKASKYEIKPDKGPQTSEHMARAHLNPVVTPEEVRDYTIHVRQPEELSRAPPQSVRTEDQARYETMFALANCGDVDSSFGVVEKGNVAVYSAYVEKARPYTAEAAGFRDNLPVTFDYEKWLIASSAVS